MEVAIVGKNSQLGRRVAHIHRGLKDNISYYSARNNSNSYFLNIKLDTEIIYYFPAVFQTNNELSFYEMLQINTINILSLLNYLRENKTRCTLIFPSTRLVYGHSDLPQNEAAKLNPKSDYAITKYLAESLIQSELNKEGLLRYYILRLGVLYSQSGLFEESIGTLRYMKRSLKESNMITLYGDGELYRTFTSLEDAAKTMHLLGISGSSSGIYNCGGQVLSLKQVALFLAKNSSKVKYIDWPKGARANESGSTIFCCSKLKEAIDISFNSLIES